MKTGSMISAVCGAIFRVVIVVVAIFAIYRGANMCYDYGYRIFTEPAISTGEGRTVTVAVTEDMSAKEIGELFENKGLVEDATLFTLQYYLSEYREDVKPGVFELSTAMTAEEMMAVMASDTTEESAEETSADEEAESAVEDGATGDETAGESGAAE